MAERYTIGQLAREADVPTSTVRYYERRGLLRADARSEGNYRIYRREALERLRFVRSAQAAGFTLSDISALIRFRDGDVAPCQNVQTLITGRLDQVTGQMDHLEHVQRMLRRWLRVCREAERTGRCGVLEGLAAAETRIPKKRRKRS
ncbi:MAG: MerR family transcriptional regulator [Planctomycetota bacterium]|jgi:MerR family mercuric resistance operon transcriptional regulator